MKPVPFSYAVTMVHQAVDYAKSIGFSPRGDYAKAYRFIDSIPLDSSLSFKFGGTDGKPMYVQGPNDSAAFVNSVMRTLAESVGEDNFHFLLCLTPDSDLFLSDDEDHYDEGEEGVTIIEDQNNRSFKRIVNLFKGQ